MLLHGCFAKAGVSCFYDSEVLKIPAFAKRQTVDAEIPSEPPHQRRGDLRAFAGQSPEGTSPNKRLNKILLRRTSSSRPCVSRKQTNIQ